MAGALYELNIGFAFNLFYWDIITLQRKGGVEPVTLKKEEGVDCTTPLKLYGRHRLLINWMTYVLKVIKN